MTVTQRCMPGAHVRGDAGGSMVFMLGEDGGIVDCSPAAEAFLTAGGHLARRFGRLAASGRDDQSRLDAALARAGEQGSARCRLGDGIELEMVLLRGAANHRQLLVIVQAPAVDHARKLRRAVLSYRLTSAEERLLEILFEGCALPEAAHRLGIARTTARSHLQHIFDKTGARRQTDLFRTIALAG